MGLFDSFKKKVEAKTEEINPVYSFLSKQDFTIENLEVTPENHAVIIRGQVAYGETIEKVNAALNAAKISSFQNDLTVKDMSGLNLQYSIATKSSNLNCRKGPGTEHDIVGKFPKGSQVLLIQKHSETWFKVRANDIEGHCHSDYLELVTP